uniref:Uncharacterized protein n=1 Tax=Panagrolaimus sp. ES5 TaxID=591445 RepID=A0AC34G4T3_9BILA
MHGDLSVKPENAIYCNDGCVVYFCVANDLVIYGGGCYHHFKAFCTSSTEKTSITNFTEITTSATKVEPGMFLYFCKTNYCNTNFVALSDAMWEEYDFFKKTFPETSSPKPRPHYLPNPLPNPQPEEPPNPQPGEQTTQTGSSNQTEESLGNDTTVVQCFRGATMPWCAGTNGSMFTYSTLAASIMVFLFARFMDIEL